MCKYFGCNSDHDKAFNLFCKIKTVGLHVQIMAYKYRRGTDIIRKLQVAQPTPTIQILLSDDFVGNFAIHMITSFPY